MIENSFLVCGITTHDPKKVRNDEFLNNVNETTAVEEEALLQIYWLICRHPYMLNNSMVQ